MDALFDDDIPVPKKYPVNGYAAKPGTGPAPNRCKHCGHCVRKTSPSGTKHFYKCGLMRHAWTNGYGTDIRANSPACREFVKDSQSTQSGTT